MLLRFILSCFSYLGLSASLSAAEASDLITELTTRYAPYANWQSKVDVDALAQLTESRYWRTAEEIASQRGDGELPLAGLHLALDPGDSGLPPKLDSFESQKMILIYARGSCPLPLRGSFGRNSWC